MISVRRILGLLALAGTIGLGAESRAQAQTDQPENAGVAPDDQKIQFVWLLLGQQEPSISQETTLIEQQDQVLDRLEQLRTLTSNDQGLAVSLQSSIAQLGSAAIQLQSQLDLGIQQARTAKDRINQTLASVDPSALQSSPFLAGQFQNLQSQLALVQTKLAPIVARPPFAGRPPATPFQ
jgi:hypothetical protein